MAAFGFGSRPHAGTGSAHTSRKLQSKLDTLDPTNRLAINDWLISFRGAAGPDLRVLFDGKHDSVQTLDDFRSVRPDLAGRPPRSSFNLLKLRGGLETAFPSNLSCDPPVALNSFRARLSRDSA